MNELPEPQELDPAPRLEARNVNAREGWSWVGQGWRLFRAQPMSLMGVLSLYVLAMLVISTLLNFLGQGLASIFSPGFARLVTGLGAAAFAATVPGITAGFMDVCKNVQARRAIHFGLLIQPFKSGKLIRKRLWTLGAIQVIALFLVVAITPDVELSSVQVETSSGKTAETVQTPQQAEQPAGPNANGTPGSPAVTELSLEDRQKILFASLLQLLIYLPVTLVLWYAPMLVYWHGCSVTKALFFSSAAIWRNRNAFLLYGVGLALAIFVAANVMGLILILVSTLLKLGSASMAVLAPLIMAMFTWAYCTIYFSYTSVFGKDPKVLTGN